MGISVYDNVPVGMPVDIYIVEYVGVSVGIYVVEYIGMLVVVGNEASFLGVVVP